MTEIVFHLGDRKTGSTAIQHALASGACVCPTRRIGYSAPINHIPLASSLTRADERIFQKNRFRRALKPARDGEADVVIVSAEHFEVVDPVEFRGALEKHAPDVLASSRFIAYVRPHAERVVSTYAERVKQGHFLGTMGELFQRTRKRETFLYTPRFTRWRDTFGDKFTLRPFLRERLLDHDVVRDVLDFALCGEKFELRDHVRSNESLCVEDLAVLRQLHLRFGPEDRKGMAPDVETSAAWAFSRLLSQSPRPGTRTRPALHKNLAKRIVATYEDDALALDTAFFEGTPMSDHLAAAVDNAVDEPQSMRAEDVFGPSELRVLNAWTWLVAEMLRYDADGWPQYFRGTQRTKLRDKRTEGQEGTDVEGTDAPQEHSDGDPLPEPSPIPRS